MSLFTPTPAMSAPQGPVALPDATQQPAPSPTPSPSTGPSPTPESSPTPQPDKTQVEGRHAPTVAPDNFTTAQNTADRLQILQTNGFTNLDPIIQVQLAASTTSIKGMLDTAGLYNDALTKQGTPVDHVLASPELASLPNPINLLLAALNNLHGKPPVAYSDVKIIQAGLLSLGYGGGLPTGGWSPQWQQEWLRHGQDEFTNPGTGNVKSLPFWEGVLQGMLPSHAIPAIVNYVHSLPAQLDQAIGTIAGDVAQVGGANFSSKVGSWVSNQLVSNQGHPITPDEFKKTEFGHNLSVIGNLLTAYTMVETGGAAAGIAAGVGSAVSKNIAEQGLAKGVAGLVGRSLPDTFAVTPRFTFVNSLYNSVPRTLYRTGTLGLWDKVIGNGTLRFLDNIPVLKRILPVVDKLGTEGNWYYGAKQVLAQRARVPLMQLGSIMNAQLPLAGVAALGAKTLSDRYSKDDPNGPLEPSVLKPIAGPMGLGLNILGAISGTPTMGLKGTETATKMFRDAHGAITSALGPLGLDSAIKTGMPGFTLKDFHDALGEAGTNDYFNTKITQYAASHHANLNSRGTGLDPTTPEARTAFQALEHDALTNPDTMHDARSSLFAQEPELVAAIRKDFLQQKGNTKLIGKRNNYSTEEKTRFFDAIKRNQLNAGDMSTVVDPLHRNLVYGPRTVAKVEDIKSQLLQHLWSNATPSFAGMPKVLTKKSDLAGTVYGTSAYNLANAENATKTAKLASDEKLYHTTHSVTAYRPDSEALVKDTPYGRGIPTTPNESIAGRTKGNVYYMEHQASDTGANPTILDLTKPNKAITDSIHSQIGDGALNPTMGRAQQAARKELGGLLKDGTERVGQVSSTPEYDKLLLMLNNRFPKSGQAIVDAYRAALGSSNLLSKDQVEQKVSDLVTSTRDKGGHAGVRITHPQQGQQVLLNSDRTNATLQKLNPEWEQHNMVSTYISSMNENGRGVIGVANKYNAGAGTMIRDDAQAAAQKAFGLLEKAGYQDAVDAARAQLQLEDRLGKVDPNHTELPSMDKAPLNPAAKKLSLPLMRILTRDVGLDPTQLSRLDPIQLASTLWRESRGMASEARIPTDAPQALKDAFASIDARNSRVVLGTDIGHSFESPLIHPDVMQQHTNILKKFGRTWGLDVTPQDSVDAYTTRRLLQSSAVDDLFNKGAITRAPGDNGSRLITYILKEASNMEPGALRQVAFYVNSNTRDKMITKLLGDTSAMTGKEIKDARASMKSDIMQQFSKQNSITSLGRKKVVDILTKPMDSGRVALAGADSGIPRYSLSDANKIWMAMQSSGKSMPTSMVGLGKVDDLFRGLGGMMSHNTASFMGKLPTLNAADLEGSSFLSGMASLPNWAINARDTLRFSANPLFDARRITKVNLKGATFDVPVVTNPFGSMQKMGILESSQATLRRVLPEVMKYADESGPLDHYISQGSWFGLYNSSHFMAWQAHFLEQQGLSDPEIKDAITKIMTYGKRTPLEQSVNTVFYPFSFNVTMMKRFGGYLLDHPVEKAMLTAGLSIYQHQDPNNELGLWLKQHAPMIAELQKLNAYEHGTGLGMFGGINAPYISEFMNLFKPNVIKPSDATKAVTTIKNLVPILSEFNSLFLAPRAGYVAGVGDFFRGSAVEQGKISWWAMQDLAQHAKDFIHSQTRPTYQTTLSDQEQLQSGIDLVSSWKTQLAKAIANKVTWPDDPSLPSIVRPKTVGGVKIPVVISSQSIQEYAHAKYPAYTVDAGAGMAMIKSAQAQQYVANLRGTFRYEAYAGFQVVADKALTTLRSSSNPKVDLAAVNAMRPWAVNLYEQDPKFIDFYKKYYESSFGPLEGLAK